MYFLWVNIGGVLLTGAVITLGIYPRVLQTVLVKVFSLSVSGSCCRKFSRD